MKKISASFLSSKDIPRDISLLNDTDVDFIHVDIMDGNSDMKIPVHNGKHLKYNLVGENLKYYAKILFLLKKLYYTLISQPHFYIGL